MKALENPGQNHHDAPEHKPNKRKITRFPLDAKGKPVVPDDLKEGETTDQAMHLANHELSIYKKYRSEAQKKVDEQVPVRVPDAMKAEGKKKKIKAKAKKEEPKPKSKKKSKKGA